MKRTVLFTFGRYFISGVILGTTLGVVLGNTGASAQSLGDAARAARKNKGDSDTTIRHFDNDNLPSDDGISVVGPPPAPEDVKTTLATTAVANDPAAAAESQKTATELQKKVDKQKEKVDFLSHELDLEQREYRLKVAEMYANAANRVRNPSQWDQEDAQYKKDIETKQRVVDTARQDLENMQDQLHKMGTPPNDKDKNKDKEQVKEPEKIGDNKPAITKNDGDTTK